MKGKGRKKAAARAGGRKARKKAAARAGGRGGGISVVNPPEITSLSARKVTRVGCADLAKPCEITLDGGASVTALTTDRTLLAIALAALTSDKKVTARYRKDVPYDVDDDGQPVVGNILVGMAINA